MSLSSQHNEAWQDEIDLFELVEVILRHKVWIAALTIAAVALSLFLSIAVMTPRYESTGLYQIDTFYSRYGVGMNLATYEAFALSDQVLEPVQHRMAPDLPLAKFRERFRISVDESARTFQVTASASDPQIAYDMITAWSDSFNRQVAAYMDLQIDRRLLMAEQEIAALSSAVNEAAVGAASDLEGNADDSLLIQWALQVVSREDLVKVSVAKDQLLTLKNQMADYVALTEIIQPVAPLSPVSPRVKLNAAIAGFLGIFTGVGLAFVSEAWRSRKQYQGRTEELLASQERAGALVEGGSASAQAKAAGQEAAAVSEGDAPSARSLKRAASEG